nr:hypothetical protein [uncultured Sphingomonas sp.]
MKVAVYFNLHRKLFSVKALEGPHKGRVIAHHDNVWLKDATFKVSEAGRQRVLRERRKNVHAYVVGTLNDGKEGLQDLDAPWATARYNPYEGPTFTSDGQPVHTADHVVAACKGGKAAIFILPEGTQA